MYLILSNMLYAGNSNRGTSRSVPGTGFQTLLALPAQGGCIPKVLLLRRRHVASDTPGQPRKRGPRTPMRSSAFAFLAECGVRSQRRPALGPGCVVSYLTSSFIPAGSACHQQPPLSPSALPKNISAGSPNQYGAQRRSHDRPRTSVGTVARQGFLRQLFAPFGRLLAVPDRTRSRLLDAEARKCRWAGGSPPCRDASGSEYTKGEGIEFDAKGILIGRECQRQA